MTVGSLLVVSWIAMSSPNAVAEVIQPNADFVTVQAAIMPTGLGPRESAALAVLAESLLGGTKTYTEFEIQQMGSSVLQVNEVSWMPDHVRISLFAPVRHLDRATSVLFSLLSEPSLKPETVSKAVERLESKSDVAWARGLLRDRLPYREVRIRDIESAKLKWLRPEHIVVGYGGSFEPGQGQTAWNRRLESWRLDRIPYGPADRTEWSPIRDTQSNLHFVEIRGREITSKDVSLPTQLLILSALGSGKGSSLWQVMRESLGVSYRQEAVLWPTRTGFQGRLVWLQRQGDGLEIAKIVRSELLAAVDRWEEGDLQRAVQFLEGCLQTGLAAFPLYVSPSHSITDSLADQAFLAAYWPKKTGSAWNPVALLSAAKQLDVKELKSEAKTWILSSEIAAVPRR